MKFSIYLNRHVFVMCELDAVLTRTVNSLTTSELVKLTMCQTAGPSKLKYEEIGHLFPPKYMYSISRSSRTYEHQKTWTNRVFPQGFKLRVPGTPFSGTKGSFNKN